MLNDKYYVETCFSQNTVSKLVEQAKKQKQIKYKWCIKQEAFAQKRVDELVRMYRVAPTV
jgi:hypothetical protein